MYIYIYIYIYTQAGSASLALTEQAQVGVLRVRYEYVDLAAKKSPAHHIRLRLHPLHYTHMQFYTWNGAIKSKLSNLLLPRKSGTIKCLHLLSTHS